MTAFFGIFFGPRAFGGRYCRVGARCVACLGAVLFLAPAPDVGAARDVAAQREVLSGPVVAQVIRVLDGDTLTVRARVWVGQDIEIKVRLAGVDAPELRGHCPRERALAKKARAFVRQRIGTGAVRLHLIHYGKYAGRVLARVTLEDGTDLGTALMGAGLARRYAGGKRRSWCG